MKQLFYYLCFLHNKTSNLHTTLFNKFIFVLALIIVLCGCDTTAFNIKSSNELKGNKLLMGRFIFYKNDMPVENDKGFTVYFKEKKDKSLSMFHPDENGYVYIPVDVGQYYIVKIKHRELNGYINFLVNQGTVINIDASDTVVNFGTIQISLQQNITSKIAFVSTYGYPYNNKLMSSSLKPELNLTQLPDWYFTLNYTSSKLGILPESTRDVVIDFPEDAKISF